MVVSFRKWRELGKYVVSFVIVAWLLYQLLTAAYDWLSPFEHRGEPDGDAVKVFYNLQEGDGQVVFKDRLRFFYWYGE